MDEIDNSDQKFSMFEAAIAADLAYYQRSSSDNISVRSRKSSTGDDSVFSCDRQEQLNLWIPGSKQNFLWFYFIFTVLHIICNQDQIIMARTKYLCI